MTGKGRRNKGLYNGKSTGSRRRNIRTTSHPVSAVSDHGAIPPSAAEVVGVEGIKTSELAQDAPLVEAHVEAINTIVLTDSDTTNARNSVMLTEASSSVLEDSHATIIETTSLNNLSEDHLQMLSPNEVIVESSPPQNQSDAEDDVVLPIEMSVEVVHKSKNQDDSETITSEIDFVPTAVAPVSVTVSTHNESPLGSVASTEEGNFTFDDWNSFATNAITATTSSNNFFDDLLSQQQGNDADEMSPRDTTIAIVDPEDERETIKAIASALVNTAVDEVIMRIEARYPQAAQPSVLSQEGIANTPDHVCVLSVAVSALQDHLNGCKRHLPAHLKTKAREVCSIQLNNGIFPAKDIKVIYSFLEELNEVKRQSPRHRIMVQYAAKAGEILAVAVPPVTIGLAIGILVPGALFLAGVAALVALAIGIITAFAIEAKAKSHLQKGTFFCNPNIEQIVQDVKNNLPPLSPTSVTSA